MFTKLALLSALAGLATLVVASPIRAPVGWHLAGTDDLDIVAGFNDAAGDATDAPAPAPAPDFLALHEHQARAPVGLSDLSRFLNGLRTRDFLDGDAPAPGDLAPRRLPYLSNDELRKLSRVISKPFIRDLLDGDGAAPAPEALAPREPGVTSDEWKTLGRVAGGIPRRDLLDGEGSLAGLPTTVGVIGTPLSPSPAGPASASPVMPFDLPGSPVNVGKGNGEGEGEGIKPILEGSLSDGGLIGGLSGKGEIQ